MSMRMTRFLLMAFCALLGVAVALVAEAQRRAGDPRGIRDPGDKGGKGGGGGGIIDACILPAQCQINAPVFNFGRASMNQAAPPVYSNASISVTCTRAAVNNLSVSVGFELWAETIADPPRQMRDIGDSGRTVGYDMYIDPARTRLWGSGVAAGTFPLQGACVLDDRNRVCTIPFLLYGTVYGGQQQVPPGNFQGAILARLNYQFGGCQVR